MLEGKIDLKHLLPDLYNLVEIGNLIAYTYGNIGCIGLDQLTSRRVECEHTAIVILGTDCDIVFHRSIDTYNGCKPLGECNRLYVIGRRGNGIARELVECKAHIGTTGIYPIHKRRV